MHKNTVKKRDKVKKKRDSSNFELKIGTVPLKAGQLESMPSCFMSVLDSRSNFMHVSDICMAWLQVC